MRDYFALPLSWSEKSDLDYPLHTKTSDGEVLKVRINDFPNEPMFTLFVDGIDVADFDDWPKIWARPSWPVHIAHLSIAVIKYTMTRLYDLLTIT